MLKISCVKEVQFQRKIPFFKEKHSVIKRFRYLPQLQTMDKSAFSNSPVSGITPHIPQHQNGTFKHLQRKTAVNLERLDYLLLQVHLGAQIEKPDSCPQKAYTLGNVILVTKLALFIQRPWSQREEFVGVERSVQLLII